jgi:hypothetical protein
MRSIPRPATFGARSASRHFQSLEQLAAKGNGSGESLLLRLRP